MPFRLLQALERAKADTHQVSQMLRATQQAVDRAETAVRDAHDEPLQATSGTPPGTNVSLDAAKTLLHKSLLGLQRSVNALEAHIRPR